MDTYLWGNTSALHVLNQCFHQLFVIVGWIVFMLSLVLISGWCSRTLVWKEVEFFSPFPLIHPQMKTILFSTLKTQKNFKLEKLFILNFYEYVHKNVRMYFREYLCFHCFSSLMIYKATQLLFQIYKLWLHGCFVFLFKTGCTECEKSKIVVTGWSRMD